MFSSPLVPGIIRYIFYAVFKEQLEHVFHCSLAVWVCLGRQHKEPVKAFLHLRQEGAGEGHCGQALGFGLFFAWAKSSLRSVTGNKKISHGAAQIFAIAQPSPRPPLRPPLCANEGFQASVVKRYEKGEVEDGRGCVTGQTREDKGPHRELKPGGPGREGAKAKRWTPGAQGRGRGAADPGSALDSLPGPALAPRRTTPLLLFWFRPADWAGPQDAIPTMLWGVPPPSLPPPLPLVEEDGGRRSGRSGHPAV